MTSKTETVAYDKIVVIGSSNPSVCTVEKNDLVKKVKAKAKGTAIVSLQADGHTVSWTITVN